MRAYLHRPPFRDGFQPRSAAGGEPSRTVYLQLLLHGHIAGPLAIFPRNYDTAVQNNFQTVERYKTLGFHLDFHCPPSRTQIDIGAGRVAVSLKEEQRTR